MIGLEEQIARHHAEDRRKKREARPRRRKTNLELVWKRTGTNLSASLVIIPT